MSVGWAVALALVGLVTAFVIFVPAEGILGPWVADTLPDLGLDPISNALMSAIVPILFVLLIGGAVWLKYGKD